MVTALAVARAHALSHPNELGAHLVYADALMEAGDELGHLIVEQARNPGVEVPDFMRERIAGRLHRRLEDSGIALGFLRSARLRRVTPREYARLVGRPEWEGVRTVSFARGRQWRTGLLPTHEVIALLTHPVMSALTEVLELDVGTFLALCRHPLRLERVSVTGTPRNWGTALPEPRLRVRELSLDAFYYARESLQWLTGAGRPLFETIEAIHLACAELEELALLARAPAGLRRIQSLRTDARREEGGWHVRLEPFRRASWARLYRGEVARVEERIAAHRHLMARLTLRLPPSAPALIDRLARAAGPVPVGVEVLPGPAELLAEAEEWDAPGPPF